MGKILITGGTGLVGQQLSQKLLAKGKEVCWLSRNPNSSSAILQFIWDVEAGIIDKKAFKGVDTIIHLAGAPIADKRWTAARKKAIYYSRIKSTELLTKYIIEEELPVKTFISASAIGIYGDRGDEWLYENSSEEKNWLAKVCCDWEAATDPLTEWGLRTACVRIGLVLAKEGGALSKMLPPVKMGINPILGSGSQYYSWIHIDDLVGIFEQLVDDENLFGIFNAVAPNPVTFKEFITALGNALGKKTFKPRVPEKLMKLMMGDMSQVLFDSARVSSKKITDKGYKFKYSNINEALPNLV